MSEALTVRDLRVAFDAGSRRRARVEILHGVDLDVAAGECVAVVGASGAGKSVLARSLLGLAGEGGARAHVTAQRLEIAGRDVARASERTWRQMRGSAVGLVLQDALGSLDPLRTVGAEVGEALRVHRRRLPRAERENRVAEALTDAGLDSPRLRMRQLPGELSGGMRQRALVASAIAAAPPLLILDEPTTALDATVAAGVLALLARIRDDGAALLLITHDLGAVARVADRVVVLDDGRVVEEGAVRTVLAAPAHAATRGLLAALPRGPKPPTGDGAAIVGSGPLLSARGLRRTYPVPGGQVDAVRNVDLDLQPGESLGIVGESGSGKSTLARLLMAAERPDAGEVRLAGTEWSPAPESRRRSRRGRIRLVPQDPLGSMDPRRSVGRILRDAGADDDAVARLLRSVQLDPAVAARMPRSLSGGQRQRVAIARALATDPAVLVLDEPVSALDVQVQAGILDLLGELQHERDLAIVLVSHDLAVVRRTCDTVVVMSRGEIVERGPVEAVWARPEHQLTRALLEASTPGG